MPTRTPTREGGCRKETLTGRPRPPLRCANDTVLVYPSQRVRIAFWPALHSGRPDILQTPHAGWHRVKESAATTRRAASGPERQRKSIRPSANHGILSKPMEEILRLEKTGQAAGGTPTRWISNSPCRFWCTRKLQDNTEYHDLAGPGLSRRRATLASRRAGFPRHQWLSPRSSPRLGGARNPNRWMGRKFNGLILVQLDR
jgi:hypothetical protein